MASEGAIEQFIFDYYVQKCLECTKNDNWLRMEEPKKMLQALLNKDIDPDIAGNKLKAHLLIIMFSLKRLCAVGLSDWIDVTSLKQSENWTDSLELLDGLQSSLDYIYETESTETLKEQARVCLFYTYVLFVQIVSHTSSEEEADAATDAKESLDMAIDKMQEVMDSENPQEKKIYHCCKKLKNKPSLQTQLPPPKSIGEMVRDLIAEATIVVKPINKCFCQMSQSPQKNSGSRDSLRRQSNKLTLLLTDVRRSKLSDVLQIAGADKYSERELQTQYDLVKKRVEKLKRQRQSLRDTSLSSSTPKKSLKQSFGKQSDAYSFSSTSSSTPKKSPHRPPRIPTTPGSASRKKASTSSSSLAVKAGWKRYSALEGIAGRQSLIDFGKSKKPPSHARVRIGKWTPEEEEEFIVKVLEFGEGNWAEIKDDLRSVRSTMQLKDKWRNISDSRAMSVAREHGLEYDARERKYGWRRL